MLVINKLARDNTAAPSSLRNFESFQCVHVRARAYMGATIIIIIIYANTLSMFIET